MALALGSLVAVSVGSQTAVISVPAASGGTNPTTFVMYQSTVAGFTPGSSGDIVGSGTCTTATTFSKSGLVPGVTYYYQAIATDSAGTPATASSTQITIQTNLATPNQNQYAMAPYLGMLDLRFNGNTIAVRFDPTASGSLRAGQAVVWTTGGSNTNGNSDPQVAPSTLAADLVCGFVNYNLKNAIFLPGDTLEISLGGNVMFLTAIGAIARGAQVNSLPSAVAGGTVGGVKSAVSGSPWAGVCLDQASNGNLCRVLLQTPANSVMHS